MAKYKRNIPGINVPKWVGSADEISFWAYKELILDVGLNDFSDSELILMIEKERVPEEIGSVRIKRYGKRIEKILNRMVFLYRTGKSPYELREAGPLDEDSKRWWEKRQKEMQQEDPIKYNKFDNVLSALRRTGWGENDQDRVRTASWAVGIG